MALESNLYVKHQKRRQPPTVVLHDTLCPQQADSTVDPQKPNLTDDFYALVALLKDILEDPKLGSKVLRICKLTNLMNFKFVD
jgi:hypothetical protein